MARVKTAEDTPTTPAMRPRVTVRERRLQNPFGSPSEEVALKDRTRVGRWFNGAIMTDKIWRAKRDGWQPVRPDELVDVDQVGGFATSPEGYVTRGERGQEVLMSMERDLRDEI